MKRAKKNPLSYLGWLGLIGIIGIYYMAPWMITFLLFFFFFTYRAKVPDELFWINVHKAAARALAGYMAFFLLSTLAIYIRGCYFHLEPPVLQDGFYQVPIAQWQQSLWFAGLVNGSVVLIVCLFLFTLMYLNHRERRFAGPDDDLC